MTHFDMDWNGPAGAEQVLEDGGPWTWYLSEAWQQAAAPELYVGPSRRPGDGPATQDEVMQAHGPWIAYWSPLLHMTTFGLGWKVPEIGLWRWVQMNMPTDHPVLRTIADRYPRSDLELAATWLSRSGGLLLRQAAFGDDASAEHQSLPTEFARLSETTQARPEYQALFEGGGDPLHLSMHLERHRLGQVCQHVETRVIVRGEPVDHLLIGEQYRTLFNALHSGTVPDRTEGRSTRVAVICPPIGWLGNYRRSRDTGLWFRGQHRWHSLGNDALSH